jgi:hypothetical protein
MKTLPLLLIVAASLNAQMQTVKDYNEMRAGIAACKSDPSCSPKLPSLKSELQLYLKGIGEGFVWANTLLHSTERDRLYCAPEKLELNIDNYQQILESFLPNARTTFADIMKRGSFKSVDDLPLGLALLLALMDAFPCHPPQAN